MEGKEIDAVVASLHGMPSEEFDHEHVWSSFEHVVLLHA